MATTTIAFGDAKSVKKWATNTWIDTKKKSYFEKRFIGTGNNACIQRKTELENGPGDTISFDLCVQMRNEPTFGDAPLEGKQESVRYYTDQITIDQVRHAASGGGAMSRKRTANDIRGDAKERLGEYFSRLYDEYIFMYLSGARGINEDFIMNTSWTGFAQNAFRAPDTDHLLYGGSATSKAGLTTSDKMSKSVIEKANVKASMMQALNPLAANMVPLDLEGKEHYVLLMSPFQEHDMRTADTTGWMDIQKAAAAAEGKNNPIFLGGLGMVNGTVLHSHRNTVRFNDYGAGLNLDAARALFMGRQAGVIGFGTSGGMRMFWKEKDLDFGNEPVIASGMILGIQKAKFNNKDFGVISVDTYATDPNA